MKYILFHYFNFYLFLTGAGRSQSSYVAGSGPDILDESLESAVELESITENVSHCTNNIFGKQVYFLKHRICDFKTCSVYHGRFLHIGRSTTPLVTKISK